MEVGTSFMFCSYKYLNMTALESEFWLALGKVILIVGLIAFTFITMVGGNPQHEAYGFRYWNRKCCGTP